jgi:hypothetical protein
MSPDAVRLRVVSPFGTVEEGELVKLNKAVDK